MKIVIYLPSSAQAATSFSFSSLTLRSDTSCVPASSKSYTFKVDCGKKCLTMRLAGDDRYGLNVNRGYYNKDGNIISLRQTPVKKRPAEIGLG